MAKKQRRKIRKSSAPRTDKKRSNRPRKQSATARPSVLRVSRDGKPRKRNPVPSNRKTPPTPKRGDRKKNRRVKPSKQQWTPKERRTKTERSLSAKKGWLTRKFNQKLKVLDAERQREREREARRDREFQKNVRKQAKEAAALAKKEKVIVYREKSLRQKGQEIHEKMEKRIEQATAEARTEAQKVFDRNLSIMERLFNAQLGGTFDQEAYDIADEFDMEPREVYTLWAYNGAVD